jgi:hypothetical protein
MIVSHSPFAAETADRRVRRSQLTATALQWLLEAQVSRGGLESIALATDDGLSVAAVGEDTEVLAAIAPCLAKGRSVRNVDVSLDDVSVHAFLVNGEELFLTLRGGDTAKHAALALMGMQGATRILRA